MRYKSFIGPQLIPLSNVTVREHSLEYFHYVLSWVQGEMWHDWLQCPQSFSFVLLLPQYQFGQLSWCLFYTSAACEFTWTSPGVAFSVCTSVLFKKISDMPYSLRHLQRTGMCLPFSMTSNCLFSHVSKKNVFLYILQLALIRSESSVNNQSLHSPLLSQSILNLKVFTSFIFTKTHWLKKNNV